MVNSAGEVLDRRLLATKYKQMCLDEHPWNYTTRNDAFLGREEGK